MEKGVISVRSLHCWSEREGQGREKGWFKRGESMAKEKWDKRGYETKWYVDCAEEHGRQWS